MGRERSVRHWTRRESGWTMSSLLACQSIVAMVFDKRLQEPVSVGKRGRSFDRQCPIVPARRFSDAPLMATQRKKRLSANRKLGRRRSRFRSRHRRLAAVERPRTGRGSCARGRWSSLGQFKGSSSRLERGKTEFRVDKDDVVKAI